MNPHRHVHDEACCSDIHQAAKRESSSEARPNLRLLIPPRTLDHLDLMSTDKPPICISPSSRIKRIGPLPRLTFRSRLHQYHLQQQQQQQASPSSTSATSTKKFNNRKTSSLPVTPVSESAASIEPTTVDDSLSKKLLLKAKFERSLSAPSKKTRRSSVAVSTSMMLVRSRLSAEQMRDNTGNVSPAGRLSSRRIEPGERCGEQIPADQAVCRICMDELGEDSKTLKTECSCKGELALAHEHCAFKWFSIKGNRNCDICGDEVHNLPVTLTRFFSDHHSTSRQEQQVQGIWHDIPVLVMISMLAYFCLLEQLLVKRMGSGALAIAIPFACVLGLLASITASTLVARRYIWGYAAAQFALVILFANIFYNLVHVEAVLSIMLSAFAGFGITMSINGLCLEYFSWQRHQAQQQQQSLELHPV